MATEPSIVFRARQSSRGPCDMLLVGGTTISPGIVEVVVAGPEVCVFGLDVEVVNCGPWCIELLFVTTARRCDY